MFGQRTVLLRIAGNLTVKRYVNQIVLTVIRVLVQAVFGICSSRTMPGHTQNGELSLSWAVSIA